MQSIVIVVPHCRNNEGEQCLFGLTIQAPQLCNTHLSEVLYNVIISCVRSFV